MPAPPSPTRSAAARRPRPRPSPPRVRWDRLGRIGLLVVLSLVAGLYVTHILSLIGAKQRSDREMAVVRSLIRANSRLEAERRSLNSPATIAAAARRLGMVKVGEHSYVLTGG
jgi:hypothetical protein